MARTRSSKPAAPKKDKEDKETQETASASASASKYTLEESSANPPNVFILPKQATAEARIVTLPHPRTAQPSRWLVCPETGVYEFTQITAPKSMPRSWLLTSETAAENDAAAVSTSAQAEARVTKHADLYVATPFDPLFLMLPALAAAVEPSRKGDEQRLFLSSEDHYDALPTLASHLGQVLRWEKTKAMIEKRMCAACETVDVDDEKMFRLDEKRLLAEIIAKARRMGKNALPDSMEEKFVKKALEAPLMVQKRTMTVVVTTETSASGASTPGAETADSQTTNTTESQASTAATSVPETPITDTLTTSMTASPEVVSLQRLRVAFDFICARYVPASLAAKLQDMFADAAVSGVDLAPLKTYLADLAKARADAHAARSVTDYSRKHGRDEEQEEARAEKKRKAEEEKKKKSQETRAARDLKKVNTSGMMKLTSFFKKKA